MTLNYSWRKSKSYVRSLQRTRQGHHPKEPVWRNHASTLLHLEKRQSPSTSGYKNHSSQAMNRSGGKELTSNGGIQPMMIPAGSPIKQRNGPEIQSRTLKKPVTTIHKSSAICAMGLRKEGLNSKNRTCSYFDRVIHGIEPHLVHVCTATQLTF